MPRGDGTGPLGKGPMTGRGEGFCILRREECGPLQVKGFTGLQGQPMYETKNNRKEAAMPGGDGMGPMGMGPMTGRAAGFCAGYGMPGYTNPIPGQGLGMGFGRGRGFWGGGRGGGRGWRNQSYATGVPGGAGGGMPYGAPYAMPYASAPTKEQELDMLKGQAEQFETTLGDIRKRLQELETEKTAE